MSSNPSSTSSQNCNCRSVSAYCCVVVVVRRRNDNDDDNDDDVVGKAPVAVVLLRKDDAGAIEIVKNAIQARGEKDRWDINMAFRL
jgi:hypothetical protein